MKRGRIFAFTSLRFWYFHGTTCETFAVPPAFFFTEKRCCLNRT
jgi:hypothetical protein